MKLAEIGEFGFIDRLRKHCRGGPGVRLGIGDDCAALELPAGELLLTTTDLLIEEVHFRRQWTDWRLLGRKCVAVNISDIAAMGGTPRFLYLGLGLSPELPVTILDAFGSGFLEAAAEYGAVLAGGDTCRSPGPLLISVTAEGSVPEGELVRRDGASPGDLLYVSGTLGDSALALHRLLKGITPDPFLAGRHFDPLARARLGRALAERHLATAMIDLSDGLVADLGHILEASSVGARVEEQSLPLSAPFAAAVGREPQLLNLALAGGEDYELLFAVPPHREGELAPLARELQLPLTRIGKVSAGTGLVLVDRQGGEYHRSRGGFDHFSAGDGG